jgi:hypothetical protein
MKITFGYEGTAVLATDAQFVNGDVQRLGISDAVSLRDTLNEAIAAAEAEREAEKEANREKFSLELGVNLNNERVCALEAGPFDTSAQAVLYAFAVRGRLTKDVAELPQTDWYDLAPGDADDLPIEGATLNIHTYAVGTVRNVDLY